MTVYTARRVLGVCVNGECQATECSYTCEQDSACEIPEVVPEPAEEEQISGLTDVTGPPIQEPKTPWWLWLLIFLGLVAIALGIYLKYR